MARVRKVPQRICVGCGQTRGKKELIRIVRSPDYEIKIDTTGKLSGRGAYLCRRMECLSAALAGNNATRVADQVGILKFNTRPFLPVIIEHIDSRCL
jgi:predicted RNA-binding protein YlxR (DUF448 family)